MDQIFTVKQLLEKVLGINIDVHQLFVDLLQAYDIIIREMRGFRLPKNWYE